MTGALVARGLHPAVLGQLPEEAARQVRRWFWLTVALLAYALLGLVIR